MRKLAHIVNPVLVGDSSDLFVAQPITFETMRIARRFAEDRVEVGLFSAQYPEDGPMVPTDFHRTPDLDRSVLDCVEFERRRKLPLLKDILDRLYQATDAEFLIYTNVDIGLQPHFYLTVDRFIEAGHDAFVINRRTISDQYTGIEQIPLMYSQLGRPHRGWDCFVFRRDAYADYELGHICVGAPRIGLALIANLIAHAANYREFAGEHATFHIGNDRSWGRGQYSDYAAHNTREVLRILEMLEAARGEFAPGTPPAKFLFYQRNRVLKGVYDIGVRFYVPLQFVQPLKKTVGHLPFWRRRQG